jgi:hypothetical protein
MQTSKYYSTILSQLWMMWIFPPSWIDAVISVNHKALRIYVQTIFRHGHYEEINLGAALLLD